MLYRFLEQMAWLDYFDEEVKSSPISGYYGGQSYRYCFTSYIPLSGKGWLYSGNIDWLIIDYGAFWAIVSTEELERFIDSPFSVRRVHTHIDGTFGFDLDIERVKHKKIYKR